MERGTTESELDALVRSADRLTTLAETADLMGDVATADRFRALAASRRLRAMEQLDE